VRFLFSLSVIVLTVAACGGGGRGNESFTHSDGRQILEVAPTMPPGSSWKKNDGIKQTEFEQLRRDLKSRPDLKNEVAALEDAGFERSFQQDWTSSGALAQSSAARFPDAAAAHKAFGPTQHLTPGWFLPLPVEDLGDEAVSSRGDPGAVYMWRRGNVLLSAWIFRGSGSSFDYDGAAREWAEKLDERLANT
jgi:hypothetical protein